MTPEEQTKRHIEWFKRMDAEAHSIIGSVCELDPEKITAEEKQEIIDRCDAWVLRAGTNKLSR